MPAPMNPIDDVGAFIPGERVIRAPTGKGALDGLRFAVKDVFDVAGATTTFGHPDWARTHPMAAATATAVLELLEAGGELIGKTRLVELGYGLTGENPWYGSPVNASVPERVAGGASCGSAAAVAAGLVDFALGSDRWGSVRIPASYCGIFGIRPSWGAVSLAGMRAVSPSFDTCGWFATSAKTLAAVGDVLLPDDQLPAVALLSPVLKPQTIWINADPATANALLPAFEALERVVGTGDAVRVEGPSDVLAKAHEAFHGIQAQESWATLGDWITSAKPAFSAGTAARFDAARGMDPAAAAAGRAFRRGFSVRMRSILMGGAVCAFPTSPFPPPLLSASMDEQDALRARTMGVTAIAGLAGLCEVTLPLGRVAGAPVGLSLMAAPGRDRALLSLAVRLAVELGVE